MQEVTLYIATPDGQRTVSLDNEISIGRTDLAQLVLNDTSLSRLHATIFREGEDVWILDENSSNGTFVNGQKVSPERKLQDGDEILLGSNTRIYVEMAAGRGAGAGGRNQPDPGSSPETKATPPPPPQRPTPQVPQPAAATGVGALQGLPLIPIIGGVSVFFIIIFAAVAILLIPDKNNDSGKNKNAPPVAVIKTGAVIPVRVLDPLGGEDPDDLDDLISSWEAEEKELDINNVDEIKVASTDSKQPSDLNVTKAFWEQQRAKALSGMGKGGGLSPVPIDLVGGAVTKQKAKLAELISTGKLEQPLDFADLAKLRLNGVLVELPMATQSYVLEVGGSAGEEEFTSFDFDTGPAKITPAHPKYKYLKQLADNFGYDLNNGRDRRQIRIRLLRMYNANSRKVFEELMTAYYQKFGIPLRVTSLTRSMDYQISLNKNNANSYRVSGKGALPPHTSGCAFDIGRNVLSAEAQNFLMAKLSELERSKKLDSLIEYGSNACFHSFIYPDGIEPGPRK